VASDRTAAATPQWIGIPVERSVVNALGGQRGYARLIYLRFRRRFPHRSEADWHFPEKPIRLWLQTARVSNLGYNRSLLTRLRSPRRPTAWQADH
jgi:hypothetical protein